MTEMYRKFSVIRTAITAGIATAVLFTVSGSSVRCEEVKVRIGAGTARAGNPARGNSGKTAQLRTSTGRADLVAVVKILEISDSKEEGDPKARKVGMRTSFGKAKTVSAEIKNLLKGAAADKTDRISFGIKVSSRGNNEMLVFSRQVNFQAPDRNGNVRIQSLMLGSTMEPMSLEKGTQCLVFLKKVTEQQKDPDQPARIRYELMPPAGCGTSDEVIAVVKTALKNISEWQLDPQLTDEQSAKIDALVEGLGSEDFKTREDSTGKLIAMGPIVRGRVRKALKQEDAEVRQRAENIIKAITPAEISGRDRGATVGEDGTIIMQGNGGAMQIRAVVK